MNDRTFVRYEVEGAWWPRYLSWPWAQRLAARHFARKVRRKLTRAARARARLEEARAMLARMQ